ncbi:NTP transferase domain-containing protein [Streptomyces kaniharaensis]|uniref:NTP transferase domain-containing protein n=1 Tax=Streptomyces kaniharaensis TaxID=212423 RepID=A0A6N7L0I5_9ACTN|nr:NTP transferase domain-containing protein [Streptomyces kaniharaensis]MQS16068.1 NTP transferase domain-containing protein [Streptomyces kaniharaensis]
MTERSTTETRPAHWYTSALVCLPARAVALVLAGGKGSRLRTAADPELQGTPKVLVPIDTPAGRTPMLGHVLTELAAVGFRRIAVLTSTDPASGADTVETYALTHSARHVELTIHREDHPLGTAGAAYAALAHLPDTPAAVVLPADTLFPAALLPSAVAAHNARSAAVTWTVTTAPGRSAQNAGRLFLDPGSEHIVHALEGVDATLPPDSRQGLQQATSTGAVILTPTPFQALFEEYAQRLAQPAEADLYRQFMPWAISQGHRVGAYDIRTPAPDLGTPDRLAAFGRTA